MVIKKLIKDKSEFVKRAKELKGRREKITLGITNLSFHRVTGALITYILEQMGFEVERKYALHEENFGRLKNMEIDMLSSAWIPSSHGIYKKEVEEKINVIELGLHYTPYALWGVPSYVPEEELNQISDLLKPKVFGKMIKQIQGIGPGAGITRFSIKMMNEYSLNNAGYEFKTGTQEDCIKAFEDAFSKKEWVIVPLWQPQFLHYTYDIRELNEPKGLLGIVDKAVLLCAEDKLNKILNLEQIEILNNIVLSNEIISKLDYYHCVEGLSEDEAVKKWINNE